MAVVCVNKEDVGGCAVDVFWLQVLYFVIWSIAWSLPVYDVFLVCARVLFGLHFMAWCCYVGYR